MTSLAILRLFGARSLHGMYYSSELWFIDVIIYIIWLLTCVDIQRLHHPPRSLVCPSISV